MPEYSQAEIEAVADQIPERAAAFIQANEAAVVDGKEPVTLETSAVEEPKELTEKDFRKLRKLYITEAHARVAACGHRFHPTNEPRTNCANCWFAFFQVHGELTKSVDEFFRTLGRDALIKMRGKTFTKNFTRFMALLAQIQKEQNESSVTGASPSSEPEAGADSPSEQSTDSGSGSGIQSPAV